MICATSLYVNANRAGTCNPDFNVSQLGLSTTWKPVKDLAFIAEATWVHIDQNNAGVANVTGGVRSGQVFNFAGQDAYSGVLRVQRNF
jgi:hypothetical protein